MEFAEEASDIIGLVNVCREFHTLPQPGGVLDQDSYFIHMVQVIQAAEANRRELDARREQMRSQSGSSRYSR